ncbi:MAG: pyridoxal 5'-phosphate synthase glutaminase subunit PdxT [Fimbriimonadaceae bacterium]|nr:pyridoxal 5'-phosphate synthase glutaminase subunit PdxT [Fimbriimonadaceae bacterium]QYK55847.1 MAG: pyridoxal 5'-phosphate synthase glutaminase subunit PdxT [Fimbriimonadaceae bacterium]
MVGVLAVQGDFSRHGAVLQRLTGTPAVEVRTEEDLARVERLVIPGGESTTVGLLLSRYGLGAAIQERAAQGMPIWGTCMGMILMAREVEGRAQHTLGLLDVTVRRNAFGAQVHSFEDSVEIKGMETPLTAVFIRAPIVTRCGEGVEPLARYDGHIVAVRQGNLVGTSFHPELTEDNRFHKWFLDL